MNNIGDRIRRFREEAGLSQKKLGVMLGLSDKAISAYESGRTLPPIETLYRISIQLKRPMHLFVCKDDESHDTEQKIYELEAKVAELLTEVKGLKESLVK